MIKFVGVIFGIIILMALIAELASSTNVVMIGFLCVVLYAVYKLLTSGPKCPDCRRRGACRCKSNRRSSLFYP